MLKNEWLKASIYTILGLGTIATGAFLGGILTLEYYRLFM